MIEPLLQAERALSVGLLDQAERLYRQAFAADPHSSIAVVGLARVALERGDEPEAWREARRALAIDPGNLAARRLAERLEEVWAYRGRSLPEAAGGEPVGGAEPGPGPEPAPGAGPALDPVPEPSDPSTSTTSERSVVDRLLRRNRP